MKIQAVKTTGIYCRADCGARPNPVNVRPMSSAVEALAAGFRPCLVCRPDRLPDFGLDDPAPEVAHAVRLIAEGFLDDANTEQLADRVGYSPRHLVRLFEQHVGATPDFVARARRAHLARRLLDESSLSITQVAFAAGFSSLRQMNRVVKELFAFTPKELRHKRNGNRQLGSLDGGLRLRLPFAGPLDFDRMLNYLGTRAIPGIETVAGQTYLRTFNHCGHAGVVEVARGDREDCLLLTLHLPGFGSILDEIQRVKSLFALNFPQQEAEQTLGRDRWLGQRVRQNPGVRLPGAWDRFETAIRIIVGQHISVAAASTLMGRIVDRCGDSVDAELPTGLHALFPSPASLAVAPLEEVGLPTRRAAAIRTFSAEVSAGRLDLTRVDQLEDILNTLQRLPGIGPWTAHLMAARVFGHPDAFPASDLGLRKAGGNLVGQDQPVDANRLEQLAAAWRPFRTAALGYLWML